MCLDDDQILLLLDGELPEGARTEVLAHLDACDACRRLVGAAAGTTRDQRGHNAASSRTVPVGVSGPSVGARQSPPAPLGRGSSIGRYLVLSLIGTGGMGRVYGAYDPEVDRRVALKLLHVARGSVDARRLLAREARALGKLSHPNVVQVYDVGEHEGDVFVAMELVEGESLDGWCRRAPQPGWPAVLAAYLAAARGLAAAHEKGLVHRDVKPSNILRGGDGRVCVADFGLASAGVAKERPPEAGAPSAVAGEVPLHETMPAPAGSPGALDERLTETGALLGTPLYMSPEQHQGARATAASDQYSFCVALYEGLYGVRPFARAKGAPLTGMLEQLLRAKSAGPPASPPAGSPVPPWIHKALARGLAPEPADRHPSMHALIAALGADPDAAIRTRWRRAGVGVVAAALLAVAGAGWARGGAFHDPCAHPERQLADVWDEGVKGRVRAAFLGTGRGYAEGTTTRVLALLDRYGADWATMRGEVCVASRGDEHRREILGLRDVCLDRRRGQLQALAALFAEKPDPQVLDKAVPAAAGLSPVAYCADTEALTARVRPPEDVALRARVATLQPRADRLEALHAAGKFRDGLALGEPLLAEARAISYPPLRAGVEYWMGRLKDATGDYPQARALFEDATASAAEGRDDILAATAWAQILFVAGDRQQRFDDASLIRRLGRAAQARAPDARTQATWLRAEGAFLYRAGKYVEAKAIQERSVVLFEKALGPDHPDVANALNNLGNSILLTGDLPLTLATHARALAIWEKAVGPEHPYVANSLNNLGAVFVNMGEYPRAREALERARDLREKALGPDHPYVATSHCNMGNVLFAMGDFPRAASSFERALAIWEKNGQTDAFNAVVGLARTKVRLGQLEAAQPLLDRGLAMTEKLMGTSHLLVAPPLLGLGELYLARKEPQRALPPLERALTLENVEMSGEIRLALAEALWQVGHDRPRARALADQARVAYEHAGHRPGLDLATRWLADHPPE